MANAALESLAARLAEAREEGASTERAKWHAFMDQLAASIIPPHTGDQYKNAVTDIFKRLFEAQLYTHEAK